MRVLAVIALFCFVVSTLSVNITAYHLGFAEQLKLNSQQTRDAARCQNSVKRTIHSFLAILTGKTKSLDSLIFTSLDVYNSVKQQVLTNCQAYLMDLAVLVMNQNPLQDPAIVAQSNYKKYGAYIVQQLAVWSEAFINGNDYKAGETQAYILQILFGIEKPSVVATPTFNSSQSVPFDAHKFIYEFAQSYYSNIGLNDSVTVNATISCVNQLTTRVPAVISAYEALSNLTTLEERLAGSLALYNEAVEVITPCTTAAKGQLSLSEPLVRSFGTAPVAFLAKYIHNIAANAPQIQQLQAQQVVDTQTGKYAHAGEVSAQLFKLILGGLEN